MIPIHNRVPPTHPKDCGNWLDAVVTGQPPMDLLRPFPADEMAFLRCLQEDGTLKNKFSEVDGVSAVAHSLSSTKETTSLRLQGSLVTQCSVEKHRGGACGRSY